MQRGSAYLALVAYLVGGWIIPVAHGVGSHAACSHSTGHVHTAGHAVVAEVSSSVTAGDGVGLSAAERGCCQDHQCGFAAYRQAKKPAQTPVDDADPMVWQSSSDCAHPVGLCAICVAQNHASPTVDLLIALPAVEAVIWLSAIPSQQLSLAAFDTYLCRGPPAV